MDTAYENWKRAGFPAVPAVFLVKFTVAVCKRKTEILFWCQLPIKIELAYIYARTCVCVCVCVGGGGSGL